MDQITNELGDTVLFKYEVFKRFILLYVSSELSDFQQHARARARVLLKPSLAISATQTGVGRCIR